MDEGTQLQAARVNQTQKYDPSNLSELFKWSKAIIGSSLVPSHISKPEDAVLVVQQGRELGISALASLNNIYVVKGKPTISAKLCVALVQQSPDCEYFMCTETTPDRAVYKTKRKNNPEPQEYTFTREMAKTAGLFSNNVWKQYTDVMLRHRCAKYLADMVYPEVTSGLYLAEEMGAEVDPEGVPVKAEVVDADFTDGDQPTPEEVRKEAHTKQSRRFHALVNEVGKRFDEPDEYADTVREAVKTLFGVESFTDIAPGQLKKVNAKIAAESADAPEGEMSARHRFLDAKIEEAQGGDG